MKAPQAKFYANYRDKLRDMWPWGEDLMRAQRKAFGPRCLLKFSGGKDSVVTALRLREHFDEVVPLFMYIIPGLSFVDEAMDYYERVVFKRKIVRVPHPGLFKWLAWHVYQDPIAAAVIDAAGLPIPTHEDVNEAVRIQEGLPDHVLAATGVRYQENMVRVQLIRTHGPILRQSGVWHPIWDLSKAEVLETMDRHGIKLSGEYEFMNKSFSGIHVSYLVPLKRHRPKDYQTICEWLPLIDAEVWRHERAGVLPPDITALKPI